LLPACCTAEDRRRAAEADAEAARERALEAEFERERERKRRNEEEGKRREEREYQRRLEVWERHERLVVVAQQRCAHGGWRGKHTLQQQTAAWQTKVVPLPVVALLQLVYGLAVALLKYEERVPQFIDEKFLRCEQSYSLDITSCRAIRAGRH
jgi:hypothetical protein